MFVLIYFSINPEIKQPLHKQRSKAFFNNGNADYTDGFNNFIKTDFAVNLE